MGALLAWIVMWRWRRRAKAWLLADRPDSAEKHGIPQGGRFRWKPSRADVAACAEHMALLDRQWADYRRGEVTWPVVAATMTHPRYVRIRLESVHG